MDYCQEVTVEELTASGNDILLKKEASGSEVFCFLS
jgi:hypothetical protein